MSEENVLGFEIAMDDFMLLEQQEAAEELLGETTNDFQGEPTESVRLDKLIQIHVEKLSGDAEMATEVEALDEANHAMLVQRIL